MLPLVKQQLHPESAQKPRVQLPLPLRIHINPDDPSRLSDSKRAESCRSAATPVISGVRSCVAKNSGHTRQISDFYNSRQINQAIASAECFTERLKVIDFILKKRTELKNFENKFKLERAAPILKNFRQNMKIKLTNEKFNKFRAACKDIGPHEDSAGPHSKVESSLLSADESLATLTKLPAKQEKDKIVLAKQKSKVIGVPRPRLPSIELSSPPDNLLDQPKQGLQPNIASSRRLSFQGDQPFTINLELPNKGDLRSPREPNPNGSVVGLADSKRDSIGHLYSKNQIIEKFADLMSGKSKSEGKSPPPPVLTKSKSTIKPLPVKRPPNKSIQEEAKKKLEQDLYNYLARHGPLDRKIIQELEIGRVSQTKRIEAKALAKFRSAQNTPSPDTKVLKGCVRGGRDISSGYIPKRVIMDVYSPRK